MRHGGLAELPFVGLVLVLSGLYACFAISQLWIEDYWIHAAIARELERRPFAPMHPLLSGGAADVPYWPYLASVALVAKLTGLESYRVLVGFGFLNLVLLCVALRRFVGEFSRERLAPFFALVGVLLLWGSQPWLISGFLHVDVLFYCFPYPSTFAIGATLLCLSEHSRHLEAPSALRLTVVTALTILVTLVHSLTAILLFAGLAALTFGACGLSSVRRYVETGVVVVGALIVAGFWPLFPLFRAVGEDRYAADRDAHVLYLLVWQRTWPVLLALPFLVQRLGRHWRDPLVTMAVAIGAVYAIGAWTQHWSYGRVLPYAVMVLQIVAGIGVAEGIGRLAWRVMPRQSRHGSLHDSSPRSPAVAALMAALVLGTSWVVERRFAVAYTEAGPPTTPYHLLRARRTAPFEKYAVLEARLEEGEVTLADAATSLVLPAFGAKVLALPRPAFFEGDYDERLGAVERFFKPKTSPEERRHIVAKYGVRYVVLDKEGPLRGLTPAIAATLGGSVIADTLALQVLDVGAVR